MIVLVALTFITKNMRKLVADRVERSVNSVLGTGSGSVAMLLGLVITIAVQSSSITTSILIPLCAAGVVSLRNAYPVTLGANVGTTITALLAAMATGSTDALTDRARAHHLQRDGHPAPVRASVRGATLRSSRAERLAEVAVNAPAAALAT